LVGLRTYQHMLIIKQIIVPEFLHDAESFFLLTLNEYFTGES
jgi:hypothetical protein